MTVPVPTAPSPLLAVQGVSRRFGGLQATDNVSFALAPGERVALIGPNGAGKTTLVNLLSGDLAPSAGRILVDGHDVTRASVADRVARGLVRTFQITRLFRSMTAAENLGIAIQQRRGLSRRITSHAGAAREVRGEAEHLLAELGLAAVADTPVARLAYGQQRLIDLAIGLALRPKVLLLDEPAAGVPHDESHRILDALDRLPSDMAVLMIEHDMDLVFRFAARILVLAAGRLIVEGKAEEVRRNAEVRRAYLGSYADDRRSA
ncbi:ABC transporter ATP-binding protein [Methylobacterium currus]|uniref:ABC transporter ATP-binding protein n=1 Tax=Methylobacterium currus TaxID=2051553 RepID=A0A2R4WVV5_9HYPH|nr:ABC transporter ATP-binding protein [Methylobacterium currus]AWB25659.1 ABC transporter ATP-binding protein [Methylobacterium currus]UHC19366.1 ABC transporter ATP-binding protein [Methylobacterium currus]